VPVIVWKGAAMPETPPAPANDDRKSAIVTVSDKKRVARADRPATVAVGSAPHHRALIPLAPRPQRSRHARRSLPRRGRGSEYGVPWLAKGCGQVGRSGQRPVPADPAPVPREKNASLDFAGCRWS
jgi:hypothetical protein